MLAAASSSLQDTAGGPECSPCRLPYIGEPPVGKRRAAILIEGPCDFCGADGRCCSQDAAGSPGCVGGVDVWQPCGVERFCCSSTPPRPYASGDDAGPLLPRPQVDNALSAPRLSPPPAATTEPLCAQVLLLLLAVGIAVLVAAAAAASRVLAVCHRGLSPVQSARYASGVSVGAHAARSREKRLRLPSLYPLLPAAG